MAQAQTIRRLLSRHSPSHREGDRKLHCTRGHRIVRPANEAIVALIFAVVSIVITQFLDLGIHACGVGCDITVWSHRDVNHIAGA